MNADYRARLTKFGGIGAVEEFSVLEREEINRDRLQRGEQIDQIGRLGHGGDPIAH